AWVILAGTAGSADEVVLKNGDRLSGKVLGLKGGKLAVETAHAGVVLTDWAQVASVRTDAAVKVRLVSDETFEGKLAAGADGRLKVETQGPAAPVEVDPAKVKSFNEPPPAWKGSVTVAARATDGNTHSTQFLAAGEAIRETERDLFLMRVFSRYGERSGVLTERNTYGLAKYQHVLYESLYGWTSVELLSDRFKDLRLGTVVAAGLGYTFLKESWIDLTGEAGVAYFDNNFRELQDDESHMGGRASARLRVALPLDLEFKDLFTWYPNFEDTADWQIRNEATLGTALGGGWSLLGGVITEIDNEPADGLEEHDNTYFVGLGWAF
ncbi:MAG TPA: DUF481 domain-containing protein, partial [Planctomycetota bacterium]|nr:DUF481 domain-containing protein [Planctomycetota bacterium]